MSWKHRATTDTDTITCPHCGALEEVDLEFIDGEEKKVNCDKCGELYKVIVDRPIVVEIFTPETDFCKHWRELDDEEGHLYECCSATVKRCYCCGSRPQCTFPGHFEPAENVTTLVSGRAEQEE